MKIVLSKVTLTLQCILHKSILWNILYQILYRIILSAYDCRYTYIIKKYHDINKSRENFISLALFEFSVFPLYPELSTLGAHGFLFRSF